eukprot:14338844-Heterocapsa_arctica.AAC.1
MGSGLCGCQDGILACQPAARQAHSVEAAIDGEVATVVRAEGAIWSSRGPEALSRASRGNGGTTWKVTPQDRSNVVRPHQRGHDVR